MIIVCVCVFPQSVDSNSTPEELVQTHLEAVQMIREKAASASQKAAEDMKKNFSCKNPPAEYAIGSEVLVRRFSSKSQKRAGKKSSTRIVRGTIVEKSDKYCTYKICYSLFDRQVEEWFNTSDITSLTLEEENKKHVSKGECDILRDSTEQTHNSDMAYENDLCSSSSDGSHLPATLTTSRQSALVSLSQPSHVCATTSEDIITE